MSGDFESIKEYTGDMILVNRLAEFFPIDTWQWNEGEIIELDNIACAIHEAQPEESEPFGDKWKHMPMENKSTDWHVGRILYFINHPEEIRDIDLDNVCNGDYCYPIPVIVDGNHRFMAALWLNDKGKMERIHCLYGGREDLLNYLTGESDVCPEE